ncbi:MAG: hypothetical protein ABIJ08_01700, partial [Nanoarchaeota archaeon]
SVYFDTQEPTVNSFTISPTIVNSGDVTFTFNLKDSACVGCAATVCSGLDRMVFTAGSYSDTIYFNSATCNNVTQLVVDLLSIDPSASGETTNFITPSFTVYDKMGNSVLYALQSLTIDTTLPDITDFTMTSGGVDFSHITDKPRNANITVKVTGDNINPNQVWANLHDLNTSKPEYYAMKGQCTGSTNTYNCKWENVEVSLSESKTVTLYFNATDTSGNVGYSQPNKAITYDGTGPDITLIRGLYYDSVTKTTYIGDHQTNITVTLTEAGVGMNNAEVYLDFSAVNASLGVVKADSCISGWECKFTNIGGVAEGKYIVRVDSATKDDLGNSYTGVNNFTLVVDKTPPVRASYNYTNRDANAIEGVIKTGDRMEYYVNITDDNEMFNAYADYSEYGGSNEITWDSGWPINTSREWEYRFTFPDLTTTGSIDGNIHFYLTDYARNTLVWDIPQYVYALDDSDESTVLNFWNNTVSCTPDVMDRELVELTPMKSYCYISLSPYTTGTEQEALSMVFTPECTANSGSAPVASVIVEDMGNDEKGSTKPYLKIKLAQEPVVYDHIDIDCPIDIYSRVGDTVYPRAEREWVNIRFDFYGNPLGEVTNNLKDEILGVKDDIDGFMEFVGIVGQIMDWAKTICKISGTIVNAMTLLKKITLLLGAAENGLRWNAVASSTIRKARVGACTSTEGVKGFGIEYVEKIGDIACGLYNCKLADVLDGEKDKDKGFGLRDMANFGGGGALMQQSWDASSKNTDPDGTTDAALTKLPFSSWIPGTEDEKHPSTYMQVQDSIVLSVMTLCLQGVLYNINKLRQIDCMYGNCLLGLSSSIGTPGGVPISACKDMKQYLNCKFVTGQLLNWFPLLMWFNAVVAQVKSIVTDPFKAVGLIFGLASDCKFKCSGEFLVWASSLCAGWEMISLAGKVLEDILAMQDQGWEVNPGGDQCKLFEDALEQSGIDDEE